MATWVVAGLGNPGPGYARHRHNVGAMVVAELARRGHGSWQSHRLLKADLAEIKVGDSGAGAVGADLDRVTLARTRTYMNDSGIPVKNALSSLKVDPAHLIVVHDELDLDFDRIRAKLGGGDNGHNGLKSIRARLGTGDYYRVRVGIGRPSGPVDVYDWVLSNFAKAEAEDLPDVVDRAADAVVTLIRKGLEETQQRFNS
ncbi:MAG: aminoacyl-tRNA hydrolase [Propionibacteriaceae bacterium]|jgi:PTH1 family peptidyl-tRNA hydrolase|nr:aminoacyl-tRNA hydrolase [Propionibacteriaceae bacterium]